MRDEEVARAGAQGGEVRVVDLVQVHTRIGPALLKAHQPPRQDPAQDQDLGPDDDRAAVLSGADRAYGRRQPLEERRAEPQELGPGRRGHHAILAQALQQRLADLPLELLHLLVQGRLGDRVGDRAGGLGVAAPARDPVEALQAVQLDHEAQLINTMSLCLSTK